MTRYFVYALHFDLSSGWVGGYVLCSAQVKRLPIYI